VESDKWTTDGVSVPAKTKPGETSGAPEPTKVDPEGHAGQIDHTAVTAEDGVDSIGGSLGAGMRSLRQNQRCMARAEVSFKWFSCPLSPPEVCFEGSVPDAKQRGVMHVSTRTR
jgi:hypothetical protein